MSAIGRAAKPLPPRDVLFNGAAFPTSFANTSPIDVTWLRSNRILTTITLQSDTDQTPDVTTHYKISHGPHDPTLQTVTDLGTGNSGSFNFLWAGLVEVNIYADDGVNTSNVLSFFCTSGTGVDGVAAGGPIGTAVTGPAPGMSIIIGMTGDIGTAYGTPVITPHIDAAFPAPATTSAPAGAFSIQADGALGTGAGIAVTGQVPAPASLSGVLGTGTASPVTGSEEASGSAQGVLGSGTASPVDGTTAQGADASGALATATTSPVDGDAASGSPTAFGAIGTGTGSGVLGIGSGVDVPHRYWRFLMEWTPYAGSYYGGSQMGMCEIAGGASVTTGGTASSNSSFGSTNPATMFDGIGASQWSSAGDILNGVYLEYDFGSGNEKLITEIFFTARTDMYFSQAPTWGVVQFSDDDSVWTDAWYAGVQTAWTEGQTIRFTKPAKAPAAAHQYWAILCQDSAQTGTGAGYSIAELLFQTKPGGATLTGSGTAWSPTNYPGLTADLAFDGDPTTEWSSVSRAVADHPVAYNFSGPVLVAEIQMQARDDTFYEQTPSQFLVAYSDDGLAWRAEWAETGVSWSSASQIQSFASPYTAPYAPDGWSLNWGFGWGGSNEWAATLTGLINVTYKVGQIATLDGIEDDT